MPRAIHSFAAALFVCGTIVPGRAATPAAEPVYLEVIVNGENEGVTLLLKRAGELLVSLDDLHKWRIREMPPVLEKRGATSFGALQRVHGIVAKLDQGQQRLVLSVPASLFQTSTVEANAASEVKLSAHAISAYVSYELGAETVAVSAISMASRKPGSSATGAR